MNRSPNRLSEVWVRSVRPDKERRWKALLRINRHLGFGNCCSHRLRQVAVQRGRRLALLDWHAATLHYGARDCWIGWTRPQRRVPVPTLQPAGLSDAVRGQQHTLHGD